MPPSTATRTEPRSAVLARRAVSIPAVVGLTAVGLLASPVLVVVAIAWDLTHGRPRLPLLRTTLFVMQYLVIECIEIAVAGPMWIAAGFGTQLHRRWAQRPHRALQAWSVGVLERRASRLLGVRFDLPAGFESALRPGPAIVVSRHVSLLDAVVPTMLYARLGYHSCGVVMATLRFDPGFDLIYRRTGSVFIVRNNDPRAPVIAAQVTRMLDGSTAAIIFPEGRLARPELIPAVLDRLRARDPLRADRLAGLRHMLPPRPAGLDALLDAAPGVDVVVIGHAGFERIASITQLARRAPLRDPIVLRAERIARSDVPTDDTARTEWLDALWLDLDAWIDRQGGSGPAGSAS